MRSARNALWLVGLLVLVGAALTAAAPSASGTARADWKPVIGKPVATPAQPLAGKRFAVAFRVTRSDTGAAITRGRMVCDPSVDGKAIQHAESFRGGVARLAFVVPASAAKKLITLKMRIESGGTSARTVATFRVQGSPVPSLAIGDVSAAEGATGTTTLSFPVTLSVPAAEAVTVDYATVDQTATAPSDYVAASGKITFRRGEKAKAIPISVVADLAIEQDETFAVTISSPVNASIAKGTATGTITNDDTQVPVAAGLYKGATQEANYVFVTVEPNRTISSFRVNGIAEDCGVGTVRGRIDWSGRAIPIRDDASFKVEGSGPGGRVDGDVVWLSWTTNVTGVFSGTAVSGTMTLTQELTYKGELWRCSSGEVKWSATLQP